MSILIVDDSLTSRTLLRAFLERAGLVDIVTATSAKEAFALLGLDESGAAGSAAPSPGNIDLILMDVEMPGIDGYQACERILACEALRDIPICVVTAHAESEHLERAFSCGARDYVPKPVRPVELLARVRAALALKHERDARRARERELLEMQERLEAVNRSLERLTTEDALTGIANRREFDAHLLREWRRMMRESSPLTLLMIDVDHFKLYNDHFGHQGGDVLLRRVAGALASVVNRPGDLIARYGGEEFAAILPGTHARGSLVVGERLRLAVAKLAAPHPGSPVKPSTSISLGAATVTPHRAASPEALLAAADAALYRAKAAGRDQVATAEPLPAFGAMPARSPPT